MNPSSNSVGLVLSGGTLKGAAHAGALAALEELRVPIHTVVGTSAGSLIATLWAHGLTVDEMHTLVHKFPGVRLLDYGFPISGHLWYHIKKRLYKHRQKATYALKVGLLNGKKLRHYVHVVLGNRRASRPYFVVATDLNSGLPVIFSNEAAQVGGLQVAPIFSPEWVVQASCALPGIFQSVPWNGHLLADGALRHYAPIDVLRTAGYQKIIVINLHTLDSDWTPLTVIDVIDRSFDILLRETIDDDIQGYTDMVLVEPSLAHIKWTSLSELEACYNEGRDAVLRKKDDILSLVYGTGHPKGSPPTINITS